MAATRAVRILGAKAEISVRARASSWVKDVGVQHFRVGSGIPPSNHGAVERAGCELGFPVATACAADVLLLTSPSFRSPSNRDLDGSGIWALCRSLWVVRIRSAYCVPQKFNSKRSHGENSLYGACGP